MFMKLGSLAAARRVPLSVATAANAVAARKSRRGSSDMDSSCERTGCSTTRVAPAEPAGVVRHRPGLLDAGVVRRPGAGGGPEELAVGRQNRAVVDASLAATHQAPVVELPQFVAV